MSGHQFLNPEGLAPARGFSHGAIPANGRTLYIAGQTGHHRDMTLDDGLVEQFARACRSVAAVITEAGGEPNDLVSMTIYTTDVPTYRESLGAIGEAYRQVFGKHFPPMALIGVAELFDPKAKVELMCLAVVSA
ncbi:MAG: RidA family protein [Acidimicrobiia bacterium]